MRVTCTNGNARNKILGSRVTVRADDGTLVDQFTVTARNGAYYCAQHPTGRYGQRYLAAQSAARVLDAAAAT